MKTRPPILIGDPQVFALEVQIRERSNDWIYGSFLMHCRGQTLGNPDDATHLRGCCNWLPWLKPDAPSRGEPCFDDHPADDLLKWLCDDVLRGSEVDEPLVPDAFSRFHITRIGMSSFDRYSLLLLRMRDGRSRLLWREGDDQMGEAIVPAGVVADVVERTEAALGAALKEVLAEPAEPSA